SVDLPLPDGPMMAVNSPRSTARLTPSSAGRPPAPSSYVLLTSVSSTSVVISLSRPVVKFLSADIDPFEVGLGVQDGPPVEQDQVGPAGRPGPLLEDGEVLEPLEVHPPLA